MLLAGSTFAFGDVAPGADEKEMLNPRAISKPTMKRVIDFRAAKTGAATTWFTTNGLIPAKRTSTGDTSSENSYVLKKEIAVCIKTAAITREGYLQTVYKIFADAAIVAYSKRSDEIKAAYDSAKNMKEARPAIKAAFDTWRETIKKAREELKKERQGKRNTFKEDVKKCRPDSRNAKDATQDSNGQQMSEGNIL